MQKKHTRSSVLRTSKQEEKKVCDRDGCDNKGSLEEMLVIDIASGKKVYVCRDCSKDFYALLEAWMMGVRL